MSAVPDLGREVLAGCQPPVIQGRRVDAAFEPTRQLPAVEPVARVDQHDLDDWFAAAGAMTEPAAVMT